MTPNIHCTKNEAIKIIKFNKEKILPVSSGANNLPMIGKDIIVIVERNITTAQRGAVASLPWKVSTPKTIEKTTP